MDTSKNNQQKSNLQEMVDQAIFIGCFKEKTLYPVLRKSLNDPHQRTALTELLRDTRANLCARFDQLARVNGLDILRVSDPKEFKILWRAKFLKDPEEKK